MGFHVGERFISRSNERGQRPLVEVRYVLTWDGMGDPLDDSLAEAALGATVSATWGSPPNLLTLESYRVDEEEGGGGTWSGYARYSPNTILLVVGQERRAFNSSGGTQHILVSKETTSSAPSNAPDFGRLIGVSESSTPTGCDIYVPVHEFEVVRAFTDGDITQAYENLLADITYTTNNSAFRGYEPRTVLFMGATGSQRGDGIWEMTFKFAHAKNQTGVTLEGEDGTISVGLVEGWEVLWVYYKRSPLHAGTETVQGDLPKFAYTERVYDPVDFSLIGINT